MVILGINAYHGNSSAAIVCDGKLIAAAEEERFNRVKYAPGFPAQAVRYCLREAGLALTDVHHVAFARNPWARLFRKALYAFRMPHFAVDRSRVAARVSGIHRELSVATDVDPSSLRARIHRVEHHLGHLASAFFVSPYEEAVALSMDGLGDFASTMWATGRANGLRRLGVVAFPHSLGLYYTAITQYLGFWKYGDEYKVMGLAAYGAPGYLDEFRRIVRTGGGGPFTLGLDYFLHHRDGPSVTWCDAGQTPALGRLYAPHLEHRLGPARGAGTPINDRHRDVAATLQARLEEVYFASLNTLYQQTKLNTLCLAGGVAFNCAANGKILDRTPFERVYVQPAAGDAGLAVGAAFHVYHQVLGHPRTFVMDHAYWGPGFSNAAIRSALAAAGLKYRELPEDALCREVARHIADGRIVGWFQGRMEWGPRALGSRSIIVDPRRPDMKEVLNNRIKHREPFRPFAPSILQEAVGAYFDHSQSSPFMLMALPVRPEKRRVIPAATHVDGTGRLQTVSRDVNPRYWRLIKEFERLTAVPVLLNTSFNENEPVVCTPDEGITCFRRTRMDVLAIGDFLVLREDVR
jgi:carbamoyltransferase